MAQRVEFFVKVRVFKDKKNESEEDKAARVAKRLIKGDEYEDEDEDEEVTYKPLVVNLSDIVAHGKEDDEHVKIFLNYGMFLVRITYEKFSRIYEELTGELIKKIK